jgi:hypothetical protein
MIWMTIESVWSLTSRPSLPDVQHRFVHFESISQINRLLDSWAKLLNMNFSTKKIKRDLNIVVRSGYSFDRTSYLSLIWIENGSFKNS